MERTENVQVFQDTEMLCKTNQILIESTKKSVKNQKVILEGDVLPEIDKNRFEQDAALIVSKKRTYEAASAYKELKTAVHNFASASNPGGGVTRGANAQEECLCRCSNLYFCLNEPDMWNAFYMPHRQAHNPIHNDDIIFTPGIKVFKTDTSMPEKMQEKESFQIRPEQIDTNHHVNNEQYIAMAKNYLPENFNIHKMRAEYRKAAVLGDKVFPFVYADDKMYLVSLADEEQKPYAIVEFEQ